MRLFFKKRRLVGVVALLVLAISVLVPATSLAASAPPPDDNNMITRLVIDLLDGVRYTFQKIGMQTVGEMVYNQKCTVDGWGSDRTVTCTPDTSRILGSTFMPSEWTGITKVAAGIFGLFGTLMVIAAMFAGVQMADAGGDDRKRAAAMEKLKNIGLVALMIGLAGPILYFLFDLNNLIVQIMGNVGGAVDFSQLFSGSGLGQVGKILVGVFSIITEISLNLVYVMRKFALMALIAITPIAMYCFIFDSTREVTKLWFQELVSNLAIQTTHAILIALFFQSYPASGGGASAFGALCFLMILPPLTNMLRSIITSGRASNFTGQGIAAAMTGVGIIAGAGKAVSAAGSVSLLGAMGRAGGGALSGGGGTGGGGMAFANAASPGSMSPDMMTQAAAMASSPGGGGARGGGGGGMTGAAMGKYGASSDAVGRASAYGTEEKQGIIATMKGAVTGDVSARLAAVKGIANGVTKVAGAAGAAVGAIGGAGLAMATGDASYIQAGATLGNRVGKTAGRVAAGVPLAGGMAASMAVGNVGQALTAAKGATDAARTTGAGRVASAVEGARAGAGALGQGFQQSMDSLGESKFGHLQNPTERKEAVRFAVSDALGSAVGGRLGQSLAMKSADKANQQVRQDANLPQMGKALEEHQFSPNDVIEYRAFPNRTDVYLNNEKLDIVPEGHADATHSKPVWGGMRYEENEKGERAWKRLETPDPTPEHEVGPNVGEKIVRPDIPTTQAVLGKGRGRIR